MTLDDIQKEIAVDFDSSPSAPANTTTEWARRRTLINRFEREWARTKGYKWSELLKEATLTTTADQASVTCPTDFKARNIVLREDGTLKIGSVWYTFINYDEKNSINDSQKYCYVLGNDAEGYTLYINPTPDDAYTVNFPYFTNNLATESDASTETEVLTNTDDITKCPDPYFIIYSTLATLFKDDDEGNKGVDYERLAIDRLNNMLADASSGGLNQSLEIPDYYERMGAPAYGE